jgi:predicted amidohydrolase
MTKIVKAAAIQIDAKLGDCSWNIKSCERLAAHAVNEGAKWIAVPELFNTGMAWEPALADAIETDEGPAATFLQNFSLKNEIVIGGSFLCRLSDGTVRNRYLAFANGRLIGKHDKDLPTMWENAFYEEGDPDDTGELGSYDGIRLGAAVCWEFMRTRTARRLQNKVDIIMGGSCWWSIPEIFPAWIRTGLEYRNSKNSITCLLETARIAGAPVIHAAHCGEFDCPSLCAPIPYRGHFEGNASIIDANGKIIALRTYQEGEGIVCANVSLVQNDISVQVPGRFWLKSRGLLPWYAWHVERWLGKRWYRNNVLGK